MENTQVLRFGVIGVGNIGFVHASCIYGGNIQGAQLCAICDSKPHMEEELAGYFPDVNFYADYHEMLLKEQLDAVIVSVPHPKHSDIAIAAFESGLHVLVEKPMDITLSKAKKLCEAARKSGKQFGIMFNQRTGDLFSKAKEIVANYDVDGIHFDDYFYPSPDNSFDAKSYAAYKSAGGKLSLGDWRRENVNTLVRNVYAAIKSIDSSVVFGISPQGNMWNNYNTQYIDVEKWVTNSGYIDYIMPQIYFGFNNTACPYTQTVANWNSLITNKNITLYIGLSPYKIGTTDNFAGNGKTEWLNNTDIIARQVTTSRKYARCGGFALFRYASVFSPAANVSVQVKTEMSNLKDVLS